MSANSLCLGQRQACAIRVTRLNSDCTPAEGDDNAVVSAGLVTLNIDPEVEEGATYQPKNACDQIRWTAEEEDRITRWTGDFEFSDFDFELMEIMFNAALLVGAATSPWEGQNIGVSGAGPNSPSGNGVGIELWVKNAGLGDQGQCGPVSDVPPYTRYVLPLVKVRPGGRTFNVDAGVLAGSIKASPNPQWGQGPWGDWQAEVGFEDSALASESWVQFWDDDIPDTDGCGYLSVPSGS